MSSIIGQAMELGPTGAAGAGGMPALGSIANFVSGIPGAIGGMFSGGGGVPTPPTDTPYSAGGPSSSGDPNAGAGYPATTGSSYGLSAPPIPSPAAVMAAPGTGSAPVSYSPSGAPFSPATAATGSGDPTSGTSTGFGSKFWDWLGSDFKPGAGGKGMFATPLGSLGTVARLLQQYQAWQTARTLQDPAALAKGAAGLYRPMGRAMKENIIAPVRAEMQETGGINAPFLYAKAVAQALGPYQYQMQMQALADYLQGLEASGRLQSGYGSIDELLAGLTQRTGATDSANVSGGGS